MIALRSRLCCDRGMHQLLELGGSTNGVSGVFGVHKGTKAGCTSLLLMSVEGVGLFIEELTLQSTRWWKIDRFVVF